MAIGGMVLPLGLFAFFFILLFSLLPLVGCCCCCCASIHSSVYMIPPLKSLYIYYLSLPPSLDLLPFKVSPLIPPLSRFTPCSLTRIPRWVRMALLDPKMFLLPLPFSPNRTSISRMFLLIHHPWGMVFSRTDDPSHDLSKRPLQWWLFFRSCVLCLFHSFCRAVFSFSRRDYGLYVSRCWGADVGLARAGLMFEGTEGR